MDTGATSHLTNSLSHLHHSKPYNGFESITVGNGSNIPIHHVGDGLLPTPNKSLVLSEILHAPHINHNLLSVHQLARDNHCRIIFDSEGYVVQDKTTNKVLYQGTCSQGLYSFPNNLSQLLHHNTTTTGLVSKTTIPHLTWHFRLGHPSISIMTHLSKNQLIPLSPSHSFNSFSCHPCCVTKSHKLPFSISQTTSPHPLYLIHSDVWGPTQTPSISGFRYYVLFIDDFTQIHMDLSSSFQI